VTVEFKGVPIVNLLRNVGGQGLPAKSRVRSLAQHHQVVWLLPVVEHGVKGHHAWAIDDNVILRVSPDIGDTPRRIKVIELYQAIGPDDF
jgi:hypothetical protein